MKLHTLTVAAFMLCFIWISVIPAAQADSVSDGWHGRGSGSQVEVERTETTETNQGGDNIGGPVGGGESSGEAEGGEGVAYVPKMCDPLSDSTGYCGDIIDAVTNYAKRRVPDGTQGSDGGGGGRVVITRTDAQRIVASGSGIVRQPPGSEALVSKVVIVYTSSERQVIDTEVGGTPVRVVATPVSYTWDWGDGTKTTTTDPGAAYPNHTVFHKYKRTGKGVVITLTTTWSATYSVNGGPAQAVNGSLTTTDTDAPFDLVRLVSYLTDDAEEAKGY